MSRLPLSPALLAGLLLGACGADAGGPGASQASSPQVEPTAVLTPADPKTADAPASDDKSGGPAPALATGSGCDITDLAASYRDDDSPERGEITVRWRSASSTAAAVRAEVEGAAPEAEVVAAGETSLVLGTRIQDSDEVDGDVSVSVHVELACGASLERVFVFEDPIKACPTATLADIPGNESMFYDCAERWLAHGEGCGPDGYLLGYGGHYAKKFYRETRPKMTNAGQAWIADTLVCLQERLRSAIALGTTCADVKNIAFDSHPDCYAESGFCMLPISDVLQVPQTVDGKDLLSQEGVRQLVGIIPQCGEEYAEAITGQSQDQQVASNP